LILGSQEQEASRCNCRLAFR